MPANDECLFFLLNLEGNIATFRGVSNASSADIEQKPNCDIVFKIIANLQSAFQVLKARYTLYNLLDFSKNQERGARLELLEDQFGKVFSRALSAAPSYGVKDKPTTQKPLFRRA